MKKHRANHKSRRPGKMPPRRAIRYYWLKFKRLQDSPQKLAWGMALGVFVGMTPTVPFHTVVVLFLAPLLRVSPVTALMGIFIMNPITMAPLYFAAYKIGKFILLQQTPLNFPETLTFYSIFNLLWRGGLALQLGGLIIALPPAVMAYFLTLWVVMRYRRVRCRLFHRCEPNGVPPVSSNHSAPPGSET
jgi:uncharacterized protein (TIGR03546 family)